MTQRWEDYCESLAALPNISIDRWLGTTGSPTVGLLGFSDASTRAYAVSNYLRDVDITDSICVYIIPSKSKVVSIKTISIPNLELCDAVLFVKFVMYLKKLPLLPKQVVACSYFILQHAWILGRRQLLKSVVKNCILCQRTKPLLAYQLMGNLQAS
jgi:hypothetical protein